MFMLSVTAANLTCAEQHCSAVFCNPAAACTSDTWQSHPGENDPELQAVVVAALHGAVNKLPTSMAVFQVVQKMLSC